MTKPYHAGHAALSGIRSAQLAREGLTGSDTALEGKQGYVAAFGGAGRLEQSLDGLGRAWQLLTSGIAVKPYPSCALTHSAIDSLLELRAAHGLTPRDVTAVEVGVNRVVPDVLAHPHPTTSLERKFSMQFCAAAALADGRVDLRSFEDGEVRNAALRALMERVTMVVDPSLPDGLEQHAWSRVTLRLAYGRTLTVGPRGEPGRQMDDEWVRRTIHAFTNRNKRSMTLNMKAGDGQAIFRKLAAGADVIVEGFRPGVMTRLGADYATLSRLNPRLVYCSLSGFGQDGPYRDYPAHDMNYLSLAGVLGLIGEPGRKPVIPLNLVADYAGAGMHGALGIVLALFARERTGRGQHVDVAYLDTSVSLLAATPNLRFFFSDGLAPRRGEGFLGGSYPYYAIYETRDGKLLTIGCTEPWLWENFCKAIGRPAFARFARKPDQFVRAADAEEEATRREIEAIIKTRDRDEWFALLTKADVCVGKVYDVEEMVRDPQVNHRRMIVDVEHPKHGRVRQVGVAIKLSDTPGTIRSAAPLPSEHTEDVLKDLGLSAADIGRLRDTGVIE